MTRPTTPTNAPRPGSGCGRFARLSLTAVAMGVHAMCASAETEPEAPNKTKPGDQDKRVEFDIETLKARGLDPALAEYFAQKPRFSAGTHRVGLFVNGESRGSVNLRFDAQGKLCFDRELILRARLEMPQALEALSAEPPRNDIARATALAPMQWSWETDTAPAQPAAGQASAQEPGTTTADHDACYDYRQFEPQTEVTTDPGKDEVRIVVPGQRLLQPRPGEGASHGGAGTLLNYNLMASTTQTSGGSTPFFYSDTETGLNAGDWIVRGRQNYWRQNGEAQFSMPYVYAQRTFATSGNMVQIGRIVTQNPVVGGVPIEGVQVLPDAALAPAAPANTIEGIAQTQSRIEVRQAGLLITTTVVPAGPYSLSNLPLVDQTSPIEVTLVESGNGPRHSYTVAPASLGLGLSAPPGLSVAVGRVNTYRAPDEMRRPLVVSAAKGWNVGKAVSLSAGGLVSAQYQSAGLNLNLNALPIPKSTLGVQSVFSNASRDAERGGSVGVTFSTQLPANVSLNLYGSRQSRGFRSISDTLYDTPDSLKQTELWNVLRNLRMRDTLTGSLGWSHSTLGTFSASYSRFSTYLGIGSQRVTASWTNTIGPAAVSLNLERSLGVGNSGGGGTAVYATVSLPLGKVSTRAFVSHADGRTRTGVGVDQSVNEYVSYSLSAERSDKAASERAYGTVNFRPRYAQAAISAAVMQRASTISAQLQGGVVATRHGITPSPYAVGDTFAVVSTGDLSGVRINTPSGAVWSDPWGKAVVSSLPAYRTSSIVVSTKSLRRNVDIKNGYGEIHAARGSVNFFDVNVVKVRRVLLNVMMDDGSALPADSIIRDSDDAYVTTAVSDGTVFLDNIPAKPVHARTPDGKPCRLSFRLTSQPSDTVPFEHAEALCARPAQTAQTV